MYQLRAICIGIIVVGSLSCLPEKNTQSDQMMQDANSFREKLRKKVIRRNRVRDMDGFSQESGVQDEQEYINFLKGAVVSDVDWEKINGEQLQPVYSLDQLEGAYFGDFLTSSGEDDGLYLEMDINHAKFLPKSTERLPEANTGQPESRFHVGELFGSIKGNQSIEGVRTAALQNTGSDSVQIRHVYLRYAPSKRMVGEVLSGRHIKDFKITEEDFILTNGNPTSAVVYATIGTDCSVMSFLQGMENHWEDAGESGIPINVINIFVKLDRVEDRERIRDLVKQELEKCITGVRYGVSSGEEKFQLTPGTDPSGYLGAMDTYNFVPVRPEDPMIPSNSTFQATEVETRAYSMLFPYKSESRALLKKGTASDSYPMLTKDEGREENFSVAVFTLLILGKTIDKNGEEVLHVKYSPMAIRTFPARWDVVNVSNILLRINYQDPIDVAKSMVTSAKKVMTGVFFGYGNEEPKELGAYELRDRVSSLRSMAAVIKSPLLPPEDVGEAAYEQILYRALSDMFLYLGKHSGAKTIPLRKVKNR